jgi:transposase
METTRVTNEYSAAATRLHMAMELSASRWVLLFSIGGIRARRVSVPAGDLERVQREIELAKAKFELCADALVVSCYEAGRDGFWIHRWLCSIGVRNHLVDAASIEVSQRAKRVKTDRVDVEKLLKLLMRACSGERDVWHELRVPTVQDEDHRRLHRERERLQKERTALGNRIGSLLATQGLRLQLGRTFEQALQAVRGWDGQALPPHLAAEIARMWQRCKLLDEQLHQLERQRLQILAQDPRTEPARQLMRLRSVGPVTAWLLTAEVFGWRDIANRRQLGALAGLAPTPYASGSSEREQGISKAGSRRVRSAMVEVAWMWLRLQPASELAQWFQRRFGSGGKRSRRIGIVALARKLLVALWRYLHDGVIPPGATLKAA